MATSLSNDMTRLLNKLARQLKVLPLLPNLPDEYNKDAWAEVIKNDTLPTFSRYFPVRMRYPVDNETTTQKNGWYYLNDNIIGNNKVLGIVDIDWQTLGSRDGSISSLAAWGYPDAYSYASGYGTSSVLTDQISAYALNADINSLFSNGAGIYVEQDGDIPNKFRIVGYSGQNFKINKFTVFVLLEHKDLNTISPTKMNIFEDLARADVATLLCNLKYFDGFETIFATIDLKIGDLENEANKRDEILAKLDEAHVTFSNSAQPMIVVQ